MECNWQDEMVEIFRNNLERRLRSAIKTRLFVNYYSDTDTIQVDIKEDEKLVWRYPNVVTGIVTGDLNTQKIFLQIITEYKRIIVQKAFEKAFWDN